MNIEVLIEQLNTLYTDLEQPRASSLEILAKIYTYLLNTAQDMDQRCNMLEMYLITSINDTTDVAKKKLLQLTLKIVLLNRNYYSDTPGQIEKILLLRPFETIQKTTIISKLGKDFIITISCDIADCLNNAQTTAEKIQDLINLLYKFTQVFQNEQLEYINWCLSKVKEYKIPQSCIEHSLWASAILEALLYLEQITSKSAIANLAGTEQMRNKELAEQVRMHTCRITYFIAQSKHLEEPIGFYAEDKMATSAYDYESKSPRRWQRTVPQGKREKLKQDFIALHKPQFLLNSQLITQAHSLILSHKLYEQNLRLALDCAKQLNENHHPLGVFIENVIQLLLAPFSKEQWKLYFTHLHNTVIPYTWRQQVAEMWACLSNHFIEHSNDQDCAHYKECAITCARQVNEKYGQKAWLTARLQLAKIYNHEAQIKNLTIDLEKLTESDVAALENIEQDYPRQLQFALVDYLLKPDANVEKFKYLMSENYPFGIEIMIKALLNSDAREHEMAKQAVTAKYGANHLNPLKLCDELRKQSFNRHVMIWAPIYCDAIENGLLTEQVEAWRRLKLNDNDINYKIYSYVRSLLYAEINDPNQCVPAGTIYLKEVDKKLLEIVISMMREIQDNKDSPLFSFTRNRPGLLESCFAELAFNENNIFLLEQLAQLSMNASISKITSPRKSLQSAKSPLLARVELDEESQPKRTRAMSALPALTVEIPQPQRSTTRPVQLRDDGALEPDSPDGSKRIINPLCKLSGSKSRSLSKKSGEQYSINSPPSTSPRNLESSFTRLGSVVSDSNNDLIPSYLGYFYFAQAIYSSRLKSNRNPMPADLQTFQKQLEMAKSAPNKQEQAYIYARIWLNYFDNNKDRIWITETEFQQLQSDLKQFNPEAYETKIQEKEKIEDFLIISKIKSLLETALNNTQDFHGIKHELFPPASYIYAKEIYYWMTYYYDKDRVKLDNFVQTLVQYLDEAIGRHGYLPSLYQYALVVKSNLDFFRHAGTFAFLLRKIKSYLEASERYIYIEPGQKRDLDESIVMLEQAEQKIETFGKILNGDVTELKDKIHNRVLNFITDEHDLAKICLVSRNFNRTATEILDFRFRNLGYPKEKPIALKDSIFSEKACVITFDDQTLSIIYKVAAPFGFYFECSSQFLFRFLKPCIGFAEKFYLYNKKVILAQDCVQYQPEKHTVFVSHADIAVIAMLKLLQTQSKEADGALKKLKITPLYELLKEAKSLPSSTWQSARTPNRIEIITRQYELDLSKKLAMKKVPGLAKQNHVSRPSSRGELRREYSDTVPTLLDPLSLISPRSQKRDSIDSTLSPASFDTTQPIPPALPPRKNGSSTRIRSESLMSRSRANSFITPPPPSSTSSSSGNSSSCSTPEVKK